MGILRQQSREQVPCAVCGKDAFTERQPGQWVALRCSACGIVACMLSSDN
jgi:ribosomal protein L37E